jgi:hypothetical protein
MILHLLSLAWLPAVRVPEARLSVVVRLGAVEVTVAGIVRVVRMLRRYAIWLLILLWLVLLLLVWRRWPRRRRVCGLLSLHVSSMLGVG